MAKAYLEPTDQSFTANNQSIAIYGAEGQQTITLSSTANNITIDQNIEEVILQKASTDYTYKQTGNILKVYEANTLILSIVVQGDADGSKLTFSNGHAYAKLTTDGAMKLGANTSSPTSDEGVRVFDQNQVITPLSLKSTTPSNNQSSVPSDSNFTLTFNDIVTAQSGKYITIKKTSDNSTITTIEVTDPQVTIQNDTVTINPSSNLPTDSGYYILIDKGSFVGSNGSFCSGIASSSTFGFSTPITYYPDPSPPPAPPPAPPADTTAPTLASQTPTDNAVEVAINANIVLTFSENITAVTGKNITIKKTSDNSTVTTIDAADAQVGIAANVVTVNPTINLAMNTEYYVQIDSGAFKDSSNNSYAGISSTTTFSFKTDVIVRLTVIADGVGGFAINGETANDKSSASVSSAGDVNGDGLADLIVGAYQNSTYAGRSYVVFGKSDDTAVNLSTIAAGTGGFAINGEAVDDWSGAVSSAGDVNGDGLADLIVGAYWNDTGGSNAGRSYVVFGKSDGSVVTLSTIAAGTGGFAINGEATYDQSGIFVSSAGDVNGDGLADLIVGANGNDTGGSNAGRSYVVFGKSNGAAVNLSTIAAGTGGFAINGEATYDQSGYSVSSAGDVNGDGLADLIVGAPTSGTTAADAGRSYVVFGKSDTTTVSLSTIAAGTGGFAINGEATNNYSGVSVSSAGDVNGDGLADLIVGAYQNSTYAGRSYVVFGKSDGSVVTLSTIAAGTGGFAINGEATYDQSGISVSSAGDVNGDGLADLIVGANGNDTGGSNAGRSYVIFGKNDGTAVNLSTIATGTGGFAINGEATNDYSGLSVSSAGDVNGDGLADLIVGAKGNSSAAGRSYIIFGGTQWLTTSVSGAGTVTGTAAAEAIIGSSSSDTLTGGGGIDRFYAGDSNDIIVLTASDITNLSDNSTGSPKTVVNGGGDIDTIRLTAGASLDLTAIKNQGAGGVEEDSRIETIEKIDMATDTTANILTLTANDIIDMSGMNLYNTTNGWTNGTYTLGASVSKHQLRVDGDAADSLVINAGNGGWVSAGTVTNGGATYNVYDNIAASSQILALNGIVVTNNDIVPTLTSLTPIDNAINIGLSSNITLTFSENVTAVAGKNIIIKKTSDNSTFATIGATSAQVGIAGNTVTINPTSDLASGTEYYILVDSGAFKNSVNNSYEGISSTTAFSFTTVDVIAPTLLSSSPIDNAIEVAVNANIVLTFSEDVTAVAGKNIIIKKTSDSSTVATIDAVDAQVNVVANVVTIDLTSDLVVGTEYYIQIDSGAFKDASNNDYVGIGSTTALSFNTDANFHLADVVAGTGGFAINGEAANDFSGYSVSSAGDVNGDGLADLIVGAPWNATTDSGAGRSYIIFGKSDTTAINLSTIAAGTGGFAISGEAANDNSGWSVSSAGDVNGDGLADLIIGARENDAVGSDSGKSYLVFGKSDTAAVNLSGVTTGAGGFVINGEAAFDESGWSVSGAGDVNGDGLADLIVGARSNDAAGSSSGRSYVIFGKSDTAAVNLSSVTTGTGGFAINGEAASDYSGSIVSSAGDVNGDGLADLIIGALYNDTGGSGAGRSYVVFGKSDGAVVSLSTIAAGTGGFAINGEAAYDYSGYSVSSAGDVNGDGLADLIIGTYYGQKSYVVFGKSDTAAVSLSAVAAGTGGFKINGGSIVSSAGDINGDGLADLIIDGSYVVFGKSDSAAVNLSNVAVGAGGFKIDGGNPVSSAGDINGDGLADLIVGDPYNSTTASNAGRSYIIFGGSQWLTPSVTGTGAVSGTTAAEALVGSSSADTLTGAGGIDRFYAGDGNDIIVLTSSDITNLSDNSTGSPKAIVDGGGDIDTIRLSGGANLDLTAIANQGAAGVEENSRIESIERIDLTTDTTPNTVTLTIKDVIDMSGMNLYNSGNSWTGLAASVTKHQLIIEGGANDTITINEGTGTFTNTGTVMYGGNTYNVYENATSNAQVIVLDVVGVTNNDV